MDPSLAHPDTLVALAIGYLLGSIPFGLILTRLAGTQDIRSIGSGNIGATNVLRTGRKGLAAATLLGDALKGTAAVLIVKWLYGAGAAQMLLPIAAGLGAFIGHVFPVWLKFKGGKGVATFIGILLGLYWPAALFFCAVWLAVAWLSRYSSLSALIASAATPIFLLVMKEPIVASEFLLLSLLLWITHRANIARLMAGTEGRIGGKSGKASSESVT
jgi:glycerol-3-phosphate acyltransferase PlsY